VVCLIQITAWVSGLGSPAFHLHNVAHLGHVHELVDEALAVHLGQNTALVVIPAIRCQQISSNDL
jgi:hypothetical protein